MKHLLLGGARSGKSRHAETLALSAGQQCFYIATGWAGDGEMAERIALHQQQRDKRWHLVEEPIHLGRALRELDKPDHTVLIDCLTLWLSNGLHQQIWSEQKQAFLSVLSEFTGDVYLVSNEVGSGIVPLGELSRTFADEAGRLNQAVAQVCDEVTLVVAGLPLKLKQPKTFDQIR